MYKDTIATNHRLKKVLQEWQEQSEKFYHHFFQGVSFYHQQPYQPYTNDRPIIYSSGETCIRDYGGENHEAPCVLVIPSHINRSYILDLTDELSLLRYLVQSGCHTFALDWGNLDQESRDFNFEDYLNKRLLPAINNLYTRTRKPIMLLGYCMGGIFSIAAALSSNLVSKIALLATPWDFHVKNNGISQWLRLSTAFLNDFLDRSGELPAYVLHAMFSVLNPLSVLEKFRKIGQEMKISSKFTAVEDWVNDGIPMASKLAKQCLFDWYRDNLLAQNKWCVNNKIIRAEDVCLPTLVLSPQNDHIVPPESSEALAPLLPQGLLIKPQTGHIGSIVGKKANRQVWQPLKNFFLSNKESIII